MNDCPKLGIVPSINHDLLLKASATGITFLQKTRYRQRYTGNKYSAVDINGKLYLKANDLKKHLEGTVDKKTKKKGGILEKKPPYNNDLMQISDNISTHTGELSPNNTELSTKEKPKRSYSVNKKEVRHRTLGYLNTQAGKKELYFWSISFPEHTSDDICYQAFNTWLTSLRKYKMLKEYLWIAERQDGKRAPHKAPTNTLHFHMVIPHRMDVHRANAMMRGTLRTFAKRGDIPYTIHQPQIAKYNGVDIAKDRKTKRVINFAVKKGSRALAAYLTKYVTKNNGTFTHLAWHNSRGYSALFLGVTFTIPEFQKYGFGVYLNRINVFSNEFAKFIPWLHGPPFAVMDHLYRLNSYIQSQLN